MAASISATARLDADLRSSGRSPAATAPRRTQNRCPARGARTTGRVTGAGRLRTGRVGRGCRRAASTCFKVAVGQPCACTCLVSFFMPSCGYRIRTTRATSARVWLPPAAAGFRGGLVAVGGLIMVMVPWGCCCFCFGAALRAFEGRSGGGCLRGGAGWARRAARTWSLETCDQPS